MNHTSQRFSQSAIKLGLMLATVIGGSIGTAQTSQALTNYPTANTPAAMNSSITVAINKTFVPKSINRSEYLKLLF